MKPIQHVIVLMLENRSFDHMLGYFKPDPPDPTFKGLVGSESNPMKNGTPVTVSPVATGQLPFDPSHRHESVTEQLTRGPVPLWLANVDMQGFVINAQNVNGAHGPRVMECFPENGLPVLTRLAREYTLADQWFCSVPGQTWSNRNFVHAATSAGRVNNRPYKLYGNTTIYQRLESAGATWRVYHDGFPQVLVFWELLLGNRLANFQSMNSFRAAVNANALPNYAFIEPQHFFSESNSQHPGNNEMSNRDMLAGEQLIWSVWNTLVSNPKVWAKTLLVITWDEHGGFYDHIKPQPTVPPKKGMTSPKFDFKFDVTGVRVPTVFVSPWIKRGVVDHTIYDHASIPKSVRKRFAPKKKKLTDRDEWANSWWDSDIWEQVMREDFPDIAQPTVPVDLAVQAKELAMAPTEDENDLGWLAREVERVLDAKADGVPVERAVKAKQPEERKVAPFFATRAELEAYTERILEKIR